MLVPNNVSEKATANKDKAEEEDVSSKGRTGEQLDIDVNSKDRDVFSKRRTGWTEVDGGLEVWRSGVLRGGAPASCSKDSVSTLTTFVNLHNTELSRCPFKTRSLTRPLLIRMGLTKKMSPPRTGLGSSWT